MFLSQQATAQTPEKMSYQAVIRNSSDQLVTSQTVGVQISILQSSASGLAVYVETQTPTSNVNGLVSIEIGNGTVVSGDFTAIDWANGPYFIKTETDPTGGTNYSITGTSQLLSVPYALHAKIADAVSGGVTETDPVFDSWDKSTGISITESQISDLNHFTNADETDPSIPSATHTSEMLHWDGSAWVAIAPGQDGAILTLVNGVPTWSVVPPQDVTNPTTGKIWIDRNLGASQVATSSTDADAYGDLYQWGRAADGHQIRTSGTTTTSSSSDSPGHDDFITPDFFSPNDDWRDPQNDDLWQGVSGTNNPCPSGYRLPTKAEWNAERLSWSSDDAAGAFASPLKLTAGGQRFSSGALVTVDSNGYYWSSTVNDTYSYVLYFSGSDANIHSAVRADGYSVRCIKD